MKSLILAVAILALTGCSQFGKSTKPSELPVIQFTVTPMSGKAPLVTELRWNVTQCGRVEISGSGGFGCNGSISRIFTGTTELTFDAFNDAGQKQSQRVLITITP